jgi:hypothetical protein
MVKRSPRNSCVRKSLLYYTSRSQVAWQQEIRQTKNMEHNNFVLYMEPFFHSIQITHGAHSTFYPMGEGDKVDGA